MRTISYYERMSLMAQKKKPVSGGNGKQQRRQNHGRGTVVPPPPPKPQGRWVMVMNGRGRKRMVQERPGS